MSDYEKMQKRKNMSVGLFVIGGLVAVSWLIYRFGDFPVNFSKMKSFRVYVQFPAAQGVQINTPVRFCGYQIGSVTDIQSPRIMTDRRTGKQYHQTLVELSLNKDYKDIPLNVEVKLMTRGLGSSYIELVSDPSVLPSSSDPNKPQKAFLSDGDYLQGSTGVTSEFFPAESQKKFDELAAEFSMLMKNMNDIVGDSNNKTNLRNSLANLSEATKQASETLAEFRKFAQQGTLTLTEAQKMMPSLIETSEDLSKTASELRQILEKVNDGQGSAGRFINDGKLYENLLETTEQINVILGELKQLTTQWKEKGLKVKL